jgi:hypothetical protein
MRRCAFCGHESIEGPRCERCGAWLPALAGDIPRDEELGDEYECEEDQPLRAA